MRERLAELGRRWGIDPAGVDALGAYLRLVASDEHAPTAVRDPAEGVERHVADSLEGLAVPGLAAAGLVADLGAGAGMPGLALAAARPSMRVVEVESVGRKCSFLERAIATMGLANAEVACCRAEEWRAGLDRCDAVVARALAPLPVLVEYAAPLLAEGGLLVAWKAAPDPSEEADGARAAALLGLAEQETVAPEGRSGATARSLYVYRRVGSVPNGYPRRPGMARKRPIRASTGD